MEPRPARVRETTPVLRTGSPRAQRQMGRVVEFEDALNRDVSKVDRESEGRRPLERRVEDNGNLEVNLLPLLAVHLVRNENGQPLQSTLTSVYGGHQSSTNPGGNLPPNCTHLSHNAPYFIPNCLQLSNGHVPTYVNLNFQPNAGMTYRQPPSYPSHAQGDNPSFRRASAYHPYEGYALQSPMSNYGPTHYGPIFHLDMVERSKSIQCCQLQRFKGEVPVTFIQQKKFTKTHLAVHNIKQRDRKSTRAFVTRYTDDTLQILGLHKEQRISSFVHGVKTRSLVEFLSIDLPTTYKGLMEKT
ncbi:hypothetical protein Tco_0730260 [Tanacetum coccineum]|uniref:Uncharacterized protein n=1 Tax=Tanacetum coccineum TaxID=301880 RepID=A0ABQ4YRB7_9ASTR